MRNELDGKKIALLVTDGFEESELEEPRKALERAGAVTVVVSPAHGAVRSWHEKQWGEKIRIDCSLEDADPDDFDGLVLPGGVMNPDRLRMNLDAVDFVRAFVDDGKPIASICHGPWTLIEADAVIGRRMTSYRSLKTDLENAGAEWVDEPVVVDRGLVTSRHPGDLPQFIEKMIEEFRGTRNAPRPELPPQAALP